MAKITNGIVIAATMIAMSVGIDPSPSSTSHYPTDTI
jgi:hypothetical protein